MALIFEFTVVRPKVFAAWDAVSELIETNYANPGQVTNTDKNVQEKKRKLESLSLNDIPYESRIVSMKANDSIKKRAMSKLKDMGGSKENGNKARQYLDGLLKIPFGIYHEEHIFKYARGY